MWRTNERVACTQTFALQCVNIDALIRIAHRQRTPPFATGLGLINYKYNLYTPHSSELTSRLVLCVVWSIRCAPANVAFAEFECVCVVHCIRRGKVVGARQRLGFDTNSGGIDGWSEEEYYSLENNEMDHRIRVNYVECFRKSWINTG